MIMPFSELPHYLTVKMETVDDIVKVRVESTIHTNRVVDCPTQWSVGFVQDKPNTFRDDVLCWVVKRYGLAPAPLRYQ